jgi:hypothetical protein
VVLEFSLKRTGVSASLPSRRNICV